MNITIDKILLWSRRLQGVIRTIEFLPGKVNVITGNSQTGKTAIVPIIDYCLCSSSCKIPLGKIRDSCSWFGLLFTVNSQKMFIARRAPKDGKPSTNLFFLTGKHLKVPEIIAESNTTLDELKAKLNILFGFPFIELEEHSSRNRIPRPSFRDVISFCFQPQNLIANPDVFFYKCNEAFYAEQMRMMLPFAFGAIDEKYFSQREELRDLRLQQREINRELAVNQRIQNNVLVNAKSKLFKAKSLGIYNAQIHDNASVEHVLNEIDMLTKAKENIKYPFIDENQNRDILDDFSIKEKDLSIKYSDAKRRLDFVNEILSLYSINIQDAKRRIEHLNLSDSVIKNVNGDTSCPFCGSTHSKFPQELEDFIANITILEDESREWSKTYNSALERERIELVRTIRDIESKLQSLDRERKSFLDIEAQQKKIYVWTRRVDSFLGELTEFLATISGYYLQDGIKQKADEIAKRIAYLENATSSEQVERKLSNAREQISQISFGYCKQLDIEWSENTPVLDRQNLTVKIEKDGQYAFLWEIGSGSNWLAYHIGFHLGIHRFALSHSKYIPSFVVFDQPTQVYFPSSMVVEESETYWDDAREDDLVRSNNIFKLLNQYINDTDGKIQVLLFDHAPPEMFDGHPNITVRENWRDSKLIPENW